jgi:hypothetical protein
MPIVVSPGVPPPTDAVDSTSYSGAMRAVVDPDHAGVRLIADFSVAASWTGYTFGAPFTATIYRITQDGEIVIVRSGDAAKSFSKVIYAYDDEVPLGEVVGYWAIPVLVDGTDGPTSGVAAVKTYEPAGGFEEPGVYIKCLADPDLSMPIRIQDWTTGTYTSGATAAAMLGSPFPAINADVRKAYTSQMTILTASEDEFQAFLAACALNTAYIVGLTRHRRRTGYYLLGDISPTRQGAVHSPYDAWTVVLTQMARPDTTNQSNVTPGHSFKDRLAQYPFFSDVLASGRTFREVLTP